MRISSKRGIGLLQSGLQLFSYLSVHFSEVSHDQFGELALDFNVFLQGLLLAAEKLLRCDGLRLGSLDSMTEQT